MKTRIELFIKTEKNRLVYWDAVLKAIDRKSPNQFRIIRHKIMYLDKCLGCDTCSDCPVSKYGMTCCAFNGGFYAKYSSLRDEFNYYLTERPRQQSKAIINEIIDLVSNRLLFWQDIYEREFVK